MKTFQLESVDLSAHSAAVANFLKEIAECYSVIGKIFPGEPTPGVDSTLPEYITGDLAKAKAVLKKAQELDPADLDAKQKEVEWATRILGGMLAQLLKVHEL